MSLSIAWVLQWAQHSRPCDGTSRRRIFRREPKRFQGPDSPPHATIGARPPHFSAGACGLSDRDLVARLPRGDPRTDRAPAARVFERHVGRDEKWLDVGAHYGYTAIALSRLVGPRGRVFAFEPELATAGHLTQTRHVNQLGQLIVMPLALGAPDALGVNFLPTVRGMVDRTVSAEGQPVAAFLTVRLDWAWIGCAAASGGSTASKSTCRAWSWKRSAA